jgi:hypothetical protein
MFLGIRTHKPTVSITGFYTNRTHCKIALIIMCEHQGHGIHIYNCSSATCSVTSSYRIQFNKQAPPLASSPTTHPETTDYERAKNIQQQNGRTALYIVKCIFGKNLSIALRPVAFLQSAGGRHSGRAACGSREMEVKFWSRRMTMNDIS